MGRLVHTSLGSSYLIAHVLHCPNSVTINSSLKLLIQQNNEALRYRPGIGYLITHGSPSGLKWTCIGKAEAPSTHTHNSFHLQQLIESKTKDWAITKDWTNQLKLRVFFVLTQGATGTPEPAASLHAWHDPMICSSRERESCTLSRDPWSRAQSRAL